MVATLVTPADIKLYLDQIAGAPTSVIDPALLTTVCNRAEAIVVRALGFSFQDYADITPDTREAYGTGTPWLSIQPHQQGSVTAVMYDGTSSPVGAIWTEDSDGNLYITGSAPFGGYGFWGHDRNWARARYMVTATYGYGTAPDDIKEVALELAINILKERDKGMFSDVVGVEGGGAVAVGYKGAFTARQKYIINAVKRQYAGSSQMLA